MFAYMNGLSKAQPYFLWLCWKKRLDARDLLRKKAGKKSQRLVLLVDIQRIHGPFIFCLSFCSSIQEAICSLLGMLHPQSFFGNLCLARRQNLFQIPTTNYSNALCFHGLGMKTERSSGVFSQTITGYERPSLLQDVQMIFLLTI